ncbi:MAG: glycosyl transferase, group 1, partial [Armatimonadetes bacterium]|nr:glycosyl transferase, group 1 [Armatimonadota bacterium]
MTAPTQTRGRPVLHLIDASQDTAYFRSIARWHDGERHPVAIGSLNPPGGLQRRMREMDLPTFDLAARGRLAYPRAILGLARLLRKRGAILHAHCFDPTLVGLFAARLARVPFVFTRHHSDHNIRLNKRWHTRIDSFCARHADRVIAVSEATREVLMQVEQVPDRSIRVVYNGMEPLPAPSPERVEALRAELGLDGRPICLMVARLHEEKGHRFLFEAIPEIERRCGPVTYLLAGDGPHAGQIRQEARARGVEGSVRFLGRRSDMAELYSLCTLVTLPSLAESFGFALLEAMSLERPVVAARTGGMPEVVAEGETGLIVPQADPAALAAALSRLLGDPELTRRMGAAGARRAAEFSFER